MTPRSMRDTRFNDTFLASYPRGPLIERRYEQDSRVRRAIDMLFGGIDQYFQQLVDPPNEDARLAAHEIYDALIHETAPAGTIR